MFPNQMVMASKAPPCVQPTIDPNFSSLSFWMNGQTITNGTTPLPRDYTLPNVYSNHSARYINASSPASLTTQTLTPYRNIACVEDVAVQQSMNFNYAATQSRLYTNYFAGLALGNGNFTLEGWYYFAPGADTPARLLEYAGGANIAYSSWLLWADKRYGFNFSTTSAAGTPFIIGGTGAPADYWGGAITANKWYFVSVTRNGSSWWMHVNGVLQRTFTSSHTMFTDTAKGLAIGQMISTTWPSGATASYFRGNYKDVKLYKGLAKYSAANYVVPTPYII